MNEIEGIEAEIEEHRTHLRECNEAIERFTRIRQFMYSKIQDLENKKKNKMKEKK